MTKPISFKEESHITYSLHLSLFSINRLTANVLSAMTVSMRFEGPLHSDFSQVQTNLVPYPRIHFPIISYAPILSSDRAEHQILTEMELTKSVFDMRNQMLSCNIRDGFYMSCCLLYRGDVNINNVYKCLSEIKTSKEMNFVDWCPTGMKRRFAAYTFHLTRRGAYCVRVFIDFLSSNQIF